MTTLLQTERSRQNDLSAGATELSSCIVEVFDDPLCSSSLLKCRWSRRLGVEGIPKDFLTTLEPVVPRPDRPEGLYEDPLEHFLKCPRIPDTLLKEYLGDPVPPASWIRLRCFGDMGRVPPSRGISDDVRHMSSGPIQISRQLFQTLSGNLLPSEVGTLMRDTLEPLTFACKAEDCELLSGRVWDELEKFFPILYPVGCSFDFTSWWALLDAHFPITCWRYGPMQPFHQPCKLIEGGRPAPGGETNDSIRGRTSIRQKVEA